MKDLSTHSNVQWILHCSIGDINWKGALQRLTDEELLYCLEHEKRLSGRKLLEQKARKRGLIGGRTA